jgi:hypothetical protein
MAGERQLADGNDAGTILGQGATDLVGFHGKAPSDQRAFTASIAVTPAGGVTQTSPFGFSTSAQLITALNLLNEIQALLIEKGLMAAS